MRAPAWVLLLSAVFVCIGCEGMRGSEGFDDYRSEVDSLKMTYGQYLAMTGRDILMDVGDVFRWHIAAGEGLGIDLQPTEIAQIGALYADDARVGWQDRAFGVWTETRKEGGLSWTYYRSYEMAPIYGQPRLFERPRAFKDFTLRHNSEHHWGDIGLQAHAIFLGAGVYVSPKEALDLVFGIANVPMALLRPAFQAVGAEAPQLDFSEDDRLSRLRRKHGQVWIPQTEGLEPAEMLNEWIELPY